MVIRCAGVVVRRAGRTILGPIDWQIRAGERWIVLGRNGSGKTTLVSVASMNLWPTAGTVEILGERYGRTDARELRRRIGVAGSAVEDAMRPDLTPLDLIMTARHGAFEPWWHVYSEADRARATALGERLGLGAHLHQPFSTLSAGERRRTSIARALMPDPEILILDEPTASLDLAARETLLHDLQALAGESRPAAIILVSHHLEEIPPGFGHVLVLTEGRIAAAGPIDDVLRDDVLSDAFGLPLVVEARDGRWTARRRPDARRRAD
ncbi:MAG: ABC transporter ATP-binding protein [Candidatus Limnocylindrales bacterium]